MTPISELPPLSYDVILADPPWLYKLRSSAGEAKSPQAQYDCMPVAEIAALPVGQLARGNCLCVMWTTWPMLCGADPAPQHVMRAWGFVPSTGGAWFKRTAADRQSLGPGYVMRSTCEPFVIGRMGRPQIKAQPGNLETFEDGAAIIAPVRGHSRKPDTMYDWIEKLLPHARRGLELFARQRWKGDRIRWDCWGRETDKFDVRI